MGCGDAKELISCWGVAVRVLSIPGATGCMLQVVYFFSCNGKYEKNHAMELYFL